MGIEGTDPEEQSRKKVETLQLVPESREHDRQDPCDQGIHKEGEEQAVGSNGGDSGKENDSGYKYKGKHFPIPENGSVFDDHSLSFVNNALALRENPDCNNFRSVLTDISMVPEKLTKETQDKLDKTPKCPCGEAFEMHDNALGCKDLKAMDGIDKCCAWLSVIEMVKKDHPDESYAMLQALKENTAKYQEIFIYKKKSGSNAIQTTLVNELKFLTHFQLTKVKGEDGSAGKARYLTWLEQAEVEGHYVCPLKTNIGLNTHCIGLWRDGNGGGIIYDSHYGTADFSSCDGFSNFDFVFESAKTETKVVDFVLVAYLKPSKKNSKKRKR